MVDLKRVYRPNIQGCCGAGLGRTGSPLGQFLSDCNQVLANEVGEPVSLFQFPQENLRVIYTTNSIEAVHRQFRKLTKTKSGFPNEDSLLKLLYLGV